MVDVSVAGVAAFLEPSTAASATAAFIGRFGRAALGAYRRFDDRYGGV